MNEFDKAALEMVGSSHSVTNNTITNDDVVVLINAIIQAVDTNDKMELVHKLQQIREVVSHNEYSYEYLCSVIPCANEGVEAYTVPDLTDLQMLRLKKTNKVAYAEFINVNNRTYVSRIIQEIKDKFPEPPRKKNVYYDAKGEAALFVNYCQKWKTFDAPGTGEWAWAYDGTDMILLYFVDRVFVSGIFLPKSTLEPLEDLWDTGKEAVVFESQYGQIDFRCCVDGDDYVMYSEGEKIMPINGTAMTCIYETILYDRQTLFTYIRKFEKDLVRS